MNTKTCNQTHTPGPWRVQADPEHAGKHPLHDSRFITCGKYDLDADEFRHDPRCQIIAAMRDCQNQKANARLIAAAPDMLGTLQAVAADCRLLLSGSDPDGSLTGMSDAEAIKVIASRVECAISLATGSK